MSNEDGTESGTSVASARSRGASLAKNTDPGISVATTRSRRLSLVAKTVVVFVVMALLPAATVSIWLTGLYRGAIETTERQLQTAVLAELSAVVLRHIDDVQVDAEAIAGAFSFAASQASVEADAAGAVRVLLATRRAIRAIRFEVPDAGVSTPIRQSDVSRESTPASTPEMRHVADQRRLSFAVVDATTGVLVVSIPRAQANSPNAYVTARVDLEPLRESLRTVADTRFDSHSATLMVADGERRIVAAVGSSSLHAGESSATLPIWSVIPAGTPWSRRVSIVSEHQIGDLAMVGGLETVPRLGWAVAVWRPKADAYASLTALTPRFAIAALGSLLLALLVGTIAARTISGPVAHLSEQAQRIGKRLWGTIGAPESRNDEIGDLSRSLHEMAHSLEQSEVEMLRETQLRSDLSRFMSRELVDAIVQGKHSLELGGTRAEVSVLFADVVAFTPLAESRAPEEMVSILNELFGILSEVVFRHHGTVDKFIGDCVMAVWGVPVAQPDHAVRALHAAEEMMRFLELGNEDWRERFGIELQLAIGVNSGEVIVGNIGSKKRMEYTVIGDVVNIAARLEAMARPNQILVTEATQQRVSGQFPLHALGEHKLTGRAQSTGVFELRTE